VVATVRFLTAAPVRCTVEDIRLRLSRNQTETTTPPGGRRWYSRLLAAGFLFFLAQGLIWLALGGVALVKLT